MCQVLGHEDESANAYVCSSAEDRNGSWPGEAIIEPEKKKKTEKREKSPSRNLGRGALCRIQGRCIPVRLG